MNMETVTAIGDHGSITFRKSDGAVVSRDFNSVSEDPEEHGYPHILWAEPETLTHPEMDIMQVGIWYKDHRGVLEYDAPVNLPTEQASPVENKGPKPMKPFDLEKAKAAEPVIQRCGRPARIVDFNLKNEDYPLAVVYTDEHNDEHVTEFSVEGKYYDHTSEDYRDLMMAPVKKTGWLNVYPPTGMLNVYPTSSLYETQAEADLAAGAHRLRCLPVEWED